MVEVLSSVELTPVELAQIRELMEATIDTLKRRIVSVEKSQVVMPNRFDTLLRAGLRI